MWRLLICSSVFLLIALITQGYADEHFPFLGEVSKESVNVRAGANTNFEKIDKLSRGAEVVVLAKNYEWYKVQLTTTAKAYVRADYLKMADGGLIAELAGNKVNVRASANSEATSLGQLPKGTFVKVVEQGNDWYRIEPPAGTFGWIHQDFITIKSTQVTPDLFTKPIEPPPAVIKKEEPPAAVQVHAAVVMTAKGLVEALPEPQATDVHYQLVVNGKPVYYLQDMPQLSNFAKAVVDIEGEIVTKSPQNTSDPIPLIHISKISLVL